MTVTVPGGTLQLNVRDVTALKWSASELEFDDEFTLTVRGELAWQLNSGADDLEFDVIPSGYTVAASGAAFDAARQDIIDACAAYGSQASTFNAIKAQTPVTAVTRTNNFRYKVIFDMTGQEFALGDTGAALYFSHAPPQSVLNETIPAGTTFGGVTRSAFTGTFDGSPTETRNLYQGVYMRPEPLVYVKSSLHGPRTYDLCGGGSFTTTTNTQLLQIEVQTTTAGVDIGNPVIVKAVDANFAGGNNSHYRIFSQSSTTWYSYAANGRISLADGCTGIGILGIAQVNDHLQAVSDGIYMASHEEDFGGGTYRAKAWNVWIVMDTPGRAALGALWSASAQAANFLETPSNARDAVTNHIII